MIPYTCSWYTAQYVYPFWKKNVHFQMNPANSILCCAKYPVILKCSSLDKRKVDSLLNFFQSYIRKERGCRILYTNNTETWVLFSKMRYIPGRGGGGGEGGTQVQRGDAPVLHISRRRGLFLLVRPPHVRDFKKEGYIFVSRYEVWGWKSPYNPWNVRGPDREL